MEIKKVSTKPVFWSLGEFEKLEKPVFVIIKTARQLLARQTIQLSLATVVVAMETGKVSKKPVFWSLGEYEKLEKPVFVTIKTARQQFAR